MLHYKEQERARPHRRKEQTGTKVGDEGGIITGPFVLKHGDGKEQRLRDPSPSKVTCDTDPSETNPLPAACQRQSEPHPV